MPALLSPETVAIGSDSFWPDKARGTFAVSPGQEVAPGDYTFEVLVTDSGTPQGGEAYASSIGEVWFNPGQDVAPGAYTSRMVAT